VSELREFLAILEDLEIEVEAKNHMQARQAVARVYKKRNPDINLPMAYLVSCAESRLLHKEDRKIFRLETNSEEKSSA